MTGLQIPKPDAEKAAAALTLNSLNDVRAFVAVVEYGSFSLAARHLGVSQPAVSQRVRNFEVACGLRLLDRRSGVALADPGREIYHRARLVIARVDELEATASDLLGLKGGKLSVGYATPVFAIPLIAQFREKFPAIYIEYQFGNTAALFEGLRQCRLDVAVTSLLSVPQDLIARRIATQKLMLCVPNEHQLARETSVLISQITDVQLLIREPGSMTRTLAEQAFNRHGQFADKVITIPTREGVKEAVAAGLGFGFVLSGEFGSDPRLVAVEIRDAPEPVGVYLLCHSEAADLPAVESLLEMLEPDDVFPVAADSGFNNSRQK